MRTPTHNKVLTAADFLRRKGMNRQHRPQTPSLRSWNAVCNYNHLHVSHLEKRGQSMPQQTPSYTRGVHTTNTVTLQHARFTHKHILTPTPGAPGFDVSSTFKHTAHAPPPGAPDGCACGYVWVGDSVLQVLYIGYDSPPGRYSFMSPLTHAPHTNRLGPQGFDLLLLLYDHHNT